MPAHALLAAVALLLSAAVPAGAHDVVWPGKPTGASPPVPIFLAPFASAEIAVRPEVGEPCIVAVTLNPFLPAGFIAQVATANPAVEVKVRVTTSALPLGGIVTATVNGEWHATGQPPGQGCTAVEPHPFAVELVVGAPAMAQTPNTLPAGDPVNPLTGGYAFTVTDHEQTAPLSLTLRRVYDSQLLYSPVSSALGPNWMHNFDSRLSTFGSFADVVVFPGRHVQFERIGGAWERATAGQWDDQLASVGDGYRFLDASSGLTHAFSGQGRLTAVEDRNGNALTVTPGAFGPLSVANGLGLSLAFSYSGSRLAQVADQSGRATSYSYAGDTLTGVTDALGRMTRYHYASIDAATLSAVELPRGNRPWTQEYDAFFRVFRQTDAGGNAMTLVFGEPAPGTTTVFDSLGFTSKHKYDEFGNVVEITDPLGFAARYQHDDDNRPISYIDRLGRTTGFAYGAATPYLGTLTDARGRATAFTYVPQQQAPFVHHGLAQIRFADDTAIAYDYDNLGNPLEVTDQAGRISAYGYNARGQPLTVTNPAGGVTSFGYFANGTLDKLTDAAGGVTGFAWDARRRPTQVIYANGSTRLLDWDVVDQMTREVDPRGNATRWDRDLNGNVTKLTDRLQCEWKLSYTLDDRIAAIVDPLGRTTAFAYDERRLLESRTNAAGETFRFEHDPLGLLATILDPADHAWRLGRDAEGNVTAFEDPLGHTWSFEIDSLDRVKTAVTPLGEGYSRRFDMLGRLRSFADPLFRKTMLHYDPRGFVESYEAPGGAGASFARDDMGALTAVTDALGSVWTRERDGASRLKKTIDPLGNEATFEYDSMSWLKRVGFPGGGTLDIPRNASGYPSGRIYSDGLAFSISYDAADRPISASGLTLGYDFSGFIATTNGIVVGRDPVGRIASLRYGPDKLVNYQYNQRGLLWRVSDWTGGWMEFDHDAAARGVAAYRANGFVTQTTYDDNNRVTGIVEARDKLTVSSIALKRDELGRPIEAQRDVPQEPLLSPGQDSYAYDAASQVAGRPYDGLGRPTQLPDLQLTWNLASSLTAYKFGDVTVGNGYDATGMRTSRSAQGITESYTVNYALTLPSVARVRVGGVDQRYYVHAPDGTLLWSIEAAGDAHRYYHFDETGSTLFLSDGAGTVTDTYGITPYGETVTATGSTPNPYTWLGRYGVAQEPGLPLYNARARWYDARAGRFLSRDPLIHYGPDAINPYAYCGGDPMNCRDPTGLRGLRASPLDMTSAGSAATFNGEALDRLGGRSLLDILQTTVASSPQATAIAGSSGGGGAEIFAIDGSVADRVSWPTADGVETVALSLASAFGPEYGRTSTGGVVNVVQSMRARNKRPSLDLAGPLHFGAYGLGYGSAYVGGAVLPGGRPVLAGPGGIFGGSDPPAIGAGLWFPPSPGDALRTMVAGRVLDPHAADLFRFDGSAFAGPIRNLPVTPYTIKQAFGPGANDAGTRVQRWFPLRTTW